MKHDIKADMATEGESLKKEKTEPAKEDVSEGKKQFALPRTKKKTIAFMDVPGSSQNATMKGDNAQFVKGSTKPGSPVKKPAKVGLGGYVGGKSQFALPKGK